VYTNFFGFQERPFQLVPNPAYLFLSRSHEEAMAHLNYAISHGDGFVSITGEVGTGKTTLCRAFLENLDENTEVAYIFNPQLDSLELLRAINDEFGIDSKGATSKDLIDCLNSFLIEKKSRKKNVLLLVDEAQNLKKEVLEQLRLLSNLETGTSKLIQIILVGQPELQNMLDSFELRQLRQRITLSWFLTPLNFKETREYIRHRVNIAAQKTEDKFSDWAYYHIYKFSGGIPRLINIACDRALLTAFGLNRRKVSGHIARSSIKELKSRGDTRQGIFTPAKIAITAIILLGLVLVSLYLLIKPGDLIPGREIEKAFPQKPSPAETVTTKIPPVINQPENFEEFLGTLTGRASRHIALKTALSLWTETPRLDNTLNNIDNDDRFFQLGATQNGLKLLVLGRSLQLIKKLNIPAIFEFLPPGATVPRFLTLTGISGTEISLKGGEKGQTITVDITEINPHWTGRAFIPWKNFYNYEGDIPLDAPGESIFTLKMLLRDMGFNEIKLDNTYDRLTREIVMKIQEKHGITVDGIVGAQTKIVIYNEKRGLDIPFLHSPGAKSF